MTIRNIDTLYWYHAIQEFDSFDKYKMQPFEGILWNETEQNHQNAVMTIWPH